MSPPNGNGGPWWSKLSIAALAIVSFVYIGEKLGGRYISLLENDLLEQRRISAKIADALHIDSAESLRRNALILDYNELQAESNRIQRRILEVQLRECPQ